MLYALEAADFHADNVIASGEHPVLIDLEALFQPRENRQTGQKQSYPGVETINHSVLRIGLLPRRVWSNEQSEGVDVSGLGGQAGQLTPSPVPQLTEIGTDQMKFSNERVPLHTSYHRPRLHDQDVDTLAYRDYVISGFTSAYHLLLAHRDELLQDILPRFTDDEIRCVLRPTQTYNILLNGSFHPNILRDALECDRLFDRLWMNVEQKPHLTRAIAAERADLWSGDIPTFTTHPGSQDLFTSTGECIAGFLAYHRCKWPKREYAVSASKTWRSKFGLFGLHLVVWGGFKPAIKQGLQLHPSDDGGGP